MKPGLKEKIAVDTGTLIELIYCDEPGQKLKKALKTSSLFWSTNLP